MRYTKVPESPTPETCSQDAGQKKNRDNHLSHPLMQKDYRSNDWNLSGIEKKKQSTTRGYTKRKLIPIKEAEEGLSLAARLCGSLPFFLVFSP